jgi:DNA-binding transcriptional LysR family regulator
MDRLTAMQTFVRVVDRGSFSAVARRSRTTQRGVSKQVAALEQALGARLLSRTPRSLSLTEEGERYFEQARRLFRQAPAPRGPAYQTETSEQHQRAASGRSRAQAQPRQ